MRLLALLLLLLAPLALSAQKTSAAPADSARFPVEIGDKWGYIDRAGALVIAPRFDRAWPFREGRGRVQQFGRTGFVDAGGALAVPLRFDDAYDFSGGRARIVQFEAAYSAQRGRMLPAGRKLYGFVGPDGEVVVEPRYYDGHDFVGGVAMVLQRTSLSVFGLFELFRRPSTWAGIGPGGEVLFDTGFGMGVAEPGRFSEGLAPYRNPDLLFSSASWGYLGARGDEAIRARFSRAYQFSEDLACVGQGDRVGYIDAEGTVVIPPQFGGCGPFAGGVASVQDANTGLWGYIGRAGAWVTAPQFPYADAVQDGLALVQGENERFGFFVPGDGFALPLQYEWARAFEGGLAYVRQGTVEGYIDRTGAFVWEKPSVQTASAGTEPAPTERE